MLCKQDQLSVLEQQLQEIDRSESKPLYLGSLRRDQNPERKRILDEIDTLLSEYGALYPCISIFEGYSCSKECG